MCRFLILLLVSTPFFSAEGFGKEQRPDLIDLVSQECGSCHGQTLKGGLGPDLRAQTLKGRSADNLAEIILYGIPDTAMPGWHPLVSKQDALWIANYLLRGNNK